MKKKQYKSSRIKNHRITKKIFFDRIPLTLSHTTDFRLFRIERLCRRQFQI